MKIKNIKISFSIKIDIEAYMQEYGLSDINDAINAIKENSEIAARAALENERYHFLMDNQDQQQEA